MLPPKLKSVFTAFDREGISWSMLRGEQNVAAPGADVDLLVHPDHFGAARQLLEDIGFVSVPAWGRGAHRFFLAYDPAGDWFELDIVTELAYGPAFMFRFPLEGECLARRQRGQDLFVLHPDDSFWTLLLHCLLDKRDMPARHAVRLQELAEEARVDGPLGRTVEHFCPPGWSAARLLAEVKKGEWSHFDHLYSPMMQAWIRHHPGEALSRAVTNGTLHLLEKPLLAMKRRGLSVALLGPDGAGKSTLAEGIQRSIPWPVRIVYMGLWKDSKQISGRPITQALEVLARPIALWARYLPALLFKAVGGVVIFDRYAYDALLPPRPPFVWLKRVYFWILAHTCPAPDLVLVLDAPGATMYGRKGESDPAQLEIERRTFLAMHDRIRQLHVVDATQGRDDLRRDVVGLIWRRCSANWSSS